ncbi:MAG: 50S ribosomal protein L11 methyltransferase [Methanocellales archaeon]
MRYILGDLIISNRSCENCENALVIKFGKAFAPTHPTTELCLKLMERCFALNRIKTILDAGCGTGILALAGLKLGADRAVAFDISREAVFITIENARRNNLAQYIDVILGSIDSLKADSKFKFDLIVANLYLPILLSMAEKFRELARGILIVSGFYDFEFYYLDNAMQGLGFQKRDVLFKDHAIADLPPSLGFTFGAAQYILK